MKKELVQEYTLRITQASRSELIVIMYEIILNDLASARESYEKQDMQTYDRELLHAGRFLSELMGSLDYSVPLSYRLMSLYIFTNKELTMARIKKNPELLDGVEDVIEKLKAAFHKVSEEDTSGPVMQNTQQIYAGLTYGRGTLNEMYVNGNEARRGFVV